MTSMNNARGIIFNDSSSDEDGSLLSERGADPSQEEIVAKYTQQPGVISKFKYAGDVTQQLDQKAASRHINQLKEKLGGLKSQYEIMQSKYSLEKSNRDELDNDLNRNKSEMQYLLSLPDTLEKRTNQIALAKKIAVMKRKLQKQTETVKNTRQQMFQTDCERDSVSSEIRKFAAIDSRLQDRQMQERKEEVALSRFQRETRQKRERRRKKLAARQSKQARDEKEQQMEKERVSAEIAGEKHRRLVDRLNEDLA